MYLRGLGGRGYAVGREGSLPVTQPATQLDLIQAQLDQMSAQLDSIASQQGQVTTVDARVVRLGVQLTEVLSMLSVDLANEETLMATQDDINAAVTEDTNLLGDLSAQSAAIAAAQVAIAAWIAANPSVDTSGLVTANDQLAAGQAGLDTAVTNLTAAVPVPVTPTPSA